ncbi:hypothetical protein [Cryobacterium sp. PH31-L1]|uniref:hypothetical protein n=1 Tax=Cryobacterium sp. PH31-L1 TaxID=3046199 RepID=UPI0024BBCD20|nr:hypothetical protein [Cryobacterium sp. PH31-L1]MDJ0376000.1 hypothetical protein [Cryobacterium sp. PH31-L1]
MERTRFWSIVAGALIALVVIMDGIFGISPNLRAADRAQSDTVAVDDTNAAHSAQLVDLHTQLDGIAGLERTLAELQRAVPTGAGLPEFIAQLGTLAETNSVVLTAISVGEVQAYAPVVAEAVVPGTDAAPTGASAAATAAAAAGTAPAVASARLTSANFATLVVTVSLSGSPDGLLDFVGGLQQGERLASVTNFSSTTDPNAPTASTGTVSVLLYVLHDAG